ncbi:MAG: hypothetical protein IRZ16_13580 [Myxococcaceae bacterium]|nr:hypothetical protein [Myxococcaceae bacterium]
MESHGGYLCRLDSVDASNLVRVARQAIRLEGVKDPSDVSLLVSVIPERSLVRLAWDAPFTYGRSGARWYATHHELAVLVSRKLRTTVHAYVFDVNESEEVTSYGNGARVGGERLVLSDFEPPDDLEVDIASDEAWFESLRAKWPLGHLARVYGVTRDELIRMPRYATSVLLDLGSPGAKDIEALEALVTSPRARATG